MNLISVSDGGVVLTANRVRDVAEHNAQVDKQRMWDRAVRHFMNMWHNARRHRMWREQPCIAKDQVFESLDHAVHDAVHVLGLKQTTIKRHIADDHPGYHFLKDLPLDSAKQWAQRYAQWLDEHHMLSLED